MHAGVRLLFVSLSLPALTNFARSQVPGTASVVITGRLQGPVYPCGNTSCPTYDTGQVTITVAAFSATASYGNIGGQKTAEQVAMALTTQLNSTGSPVT